MRACDVIIVRVVIDVRGGVNNDKNDEDEEDDDGHDDDDQTFLAIFT